MHDTSDAIVLGFVLSADHHQTFFKLGKIIQFLNLICTFSILHVNFLPEENIFDFVQ